MIRSFWPASCFCRRRSRRSSRASILTLTSAAAVVNATDRPFWQAARPSPSAACVFPVPLGPSAMTFSRRSIHSQRASSGTCILLSFGMALKSKLSRLLVTGNFAALMRRSIIRRSRQRADARRSCFGGDRRRAAPGRPAGSGTGRGSAPRRRPARGRAQISVLAASAAGAGELVVFPEECRQLQRLQVVGEQDLRRVAHAASPDTRHM
jgi:hypothetical protein